MSSGTATGGPAIAVLDYGIGNLRSAEKALQLVGGAARLVRDPAQVSGAAGVVLPGVGAFGACATALQASGLAEVAARAVAEGVPFLGVCVGFQLLFDHSEEDPGIPGLGIVEGVVRRISGDVKLPQMQWNQAEITTDTTPAMFAGLAPLPWFYFVHSFAPVPTGPGAATVVATCDYGGPVVAAIERGALWGTQFHPEKSGRAGLSLLASFVGRCTGEVVLS